MKTTPRSRLLLIELVCDLVIFALCAVVCVTLLVRARTMSQESAELTLAVYIAQDAAERYRAGLPPVDGYQADGTPTSDPALSAYLAVVARGEDGAATVEVRPSGGPSRPPVYSLSVGKGVSP